MKLKSRQIALLLFLGVIIEAFIGVFGNKVANYIELPPAIIILLFLVFLTLAIFIAVLTSKDVIPENDKKDVPSGFASIQEKSPAIFTRERRLQPTGFSPSVVSPKPSRKTAKVENKTKKKQPNFFAILSALGVAILFSVFLIISSLLISFFIFVIISKFINFSWEISFIISGIIALVVISIWAWAVTEKENEREYIHILKIIFGDVTALIGGYLLLQPFDLLDGFKFIIGYSVSFSILNGLILTVWYRDFLA